MRTYYDFDKREEVVKDMILGLCENDKCCKSFIITDGSTGAPQKYCSKSCSGIVRTRKWYQKRKERKKMMYEQDCVEDFHREFDCSIRTVPQLPNEKEENLMVGLIAEEFNELLDGLKTKDMVEVADGLADMLYVILGASIRCGIDLEPVFMEVHRSNMTKKGGYKDASGKYIKPETYSKANILPILKRQGYKPTLEEVFKYDKNTGIK